jgi:hypothetical protein
MNDPHLWWEVTATGMNLFVRVVPGAKKSEIAAITAEYARLKKVAVDGLYCPPDTTMF